MTWLWLISCGLLFVAGLLVGRKHAAELTALLHETEDNAAKLKAEAEEWRARFKALKG